MNAPNGNAALRAGMRRISPSWEYRHLLVWAGARLLAAGYRPLGTSPNLSLGRRLWASLAQWA
jgi:hypothetical protein